MAVIGTALPSLRCSKIRHSCDHCGHAAGPAGARVRGLMTHLCHKPVGGGGRDSAVQHPIWQPPTGLGRAILPRESSLEWEGQMRICLRRREFIAALGGAAGWPLAVRAQQAGRVRRIGVLMAGDENDPVLKTSVSAFTQALADLGWTDGRNVRMELRWYGGDNDRIR